MRDHQRTNLVELTLASALALAVATSCGHAAQPDDGGGERTDASTVGDDVGSVEDAPSRGDAEIPDADEVCELGSGASRVPAALDTTFEPGHDTEIVHLVSHRGAVYAGTSQWMSTDGTTGARVLVKRSATAPWTAVLRADGTDAFPTVRVLVLRSIATAEGDSLLLAITSSVDSMDIPGRMEWIRGGGERFERGLVLPWDGADVRSVVSRIEDGETVVYLGARPGGIVRSVWDPVAGTFRFGAVELENDTAVRGNRFMSMADCGGALYASQEGRIFRRTEALDPAARWEIFDEIDTGGGGSGFRGLTCVVHAGRPALLAALEGPGTVFRYTSLPDPSATAVRATERTIELEPHDAIERSLREGACRAETQIRFVIAAYSNMPELSPGVRALGIEFNYEGRPGAPGTCPSGRSCQGIFDAGACFFVRDARGSGEPAYRFQCLSGPDFAVSPDGYPTTHGEAFVASRTLVVSPFDGRIFVGGYDANSQPATGSAWIATTVSPWED